MLRVPRQKYLALFCNSAFSPVLCPQPYCKAHSTIIALMLSCEVQEGPGAASTMPMMNRLVAPTAEGYSVRSPTLTAPCSVLSCGQDTARRPAYRFVPHHQRRHLPHAM